ncbi:hypothetical protein ACNFBT_02015 [Pseudomonas sp. NY15181]|uniref:hypothetical protein n=1 Tax=Pseudomonas sp. NY15181 TaxID=3400349 RepID=UPI003A843777
MRYLHRLLRPFLALPLLGAVQLSHAEVDDSLVAAIDSIWQTPPPQVSLLSEHFDNRTSNAGTAYRAEVKGSPTYLVTGDEAASVVAGRKRFNAVSTPWGNFPKLQMQNARLLEMRLPKKRYRILAGPGVGLFSVGDWQRYSFLHVLDVSTPSAPVYYPLFSDAYLGERVLGQLPDSAVLNFARLVPSSRSGDGSTDAYEVTLYALGHKGPQPVIKDGHVLAYALKREDGSWVISSLDRAVATNARDEEKRPFVAAPRPALFVNAPPAAAVTDKQ